MDELILIDFVTILLVMSTVGPNTMLEDAHTTRQLHCQ